MKERRRVAYSAASAEVGRLAHDSTERIRHEMRSVAPELARRSWKWMRTLAGGAHPSRYYTDRSDYPILTIPYLLDRRIARRADLEFRRDLAYSTINGYYFLRLCDNLMDGDATVETSLLPAAAFFHTEFQSVYARCFPAGHAFWKVYRRDWFSTAEATLADQSAKSFGLAKFRRIAARKTLAARIPVAAVCFRHGRADLWPAWREFMERLGRFVQMADDLCDFAADVRRGDGATYFLSEAERRRPSGKSRLDWILGGGFRWGLDTCSRWLGDLRRRAERLGVPELDQLLEARERDLVAWGQATQQRLVELAPLASFLEKQSGVAKPVPFATPIRRRHVA